MATWGYKVGKSNTISNRNNMFHIPNSKTIRFKFLKKFVISGNINTYLEYYQTLIGGVFWVFMEKYVNLRLNMHFSKYLNFYAFLIIKFTYFCASICFKKLKKSWSFRLIYLCEVCIIYVTLKIGEKATVVKFSTTDFQRQLLLIVAWSPFTCSLCHKRWAHSKGKKMQAHKHSTSPCFKLLKSMICIPYHSHTTIYC